MIGSETWASDAQSAGRSRWSSGRTAASAGARAASRRGSARGAPRAAARAEPRHPVHVTMRMVGSASGLRRRDMYFALREATIVTAKGTAALVAAPPAQPRSRQRAAPSPEGSPSESAAERAGAPRAAWREAHRPRGSPVVRAPTSAVAASTSLAAKQRTPGGAREAERVRGGTPRQGAARLRASTTARALQATASYCRLLQATASERRLSGD